MCVVISMLINYASMRRHIHADKLRKYHVQVDEVCCNHAVCSVVTAAATEEAVVNHCAIIHDEDKDFGDITVIDPTPKVTDYSLSSQKIDLAKLAHLSDQQREELLAVLFL